MLRGRQASAPFGKKGALVGAGDLELVSVGKVYGNGTPAVVDVHLTVARGEFVAFLGPSGCGKTTTLRMIAGFEDVTSGDIFVRGRRVNDMPPEQRPTSMIFQNYALFPNMTVRENVSFGLEVKRVPRSEVRARVSRILETLSLADVADHRTDRLSGGQRQRIALARGLVVEPEILLLDEPLGALDANLRKAIQAELKLLQRSLGITFVFVTHAQSEALTMSDRIVVMNQGRVEQISEPYELYTRPRTAFVAQFIGRNTIIDGRVREVRRGVGILDTQYGALAGRAVGDLPPGGFGRIVIPSEAFDVYPAALGPPPVAPGYAENWLHGAVVRRDIVGHLIHMSVRLKDGLGVQLEGHVDRLRTDALRPEMSVSLTWHPDEATLIVG